MGNCWEKCKDCLNPKNYNKLSDSEEDVMLEDVNEEDLFEDDGSSSSSQPLKPRKPQIPFDCWGEILMFIDGSEKEILFAVLRLSKTIRNHIINVGNNCLKHFQFVLLQNFEIENEKGYVLNLFIENHLDLKEATFNNMTNLHKLEMSGCRNIKGIELVNLKKLSVLILNGCAEFDDVVFIKNKHFPQSLRELRMLYCHHCGEEGLKNLENLRTLEIRQNHNIGDEIFQKMNFLTHLHLSKCGNMASSGFLYLKNLRNLHVEECLTNDSIFKNLKNLEHLEIYNCVNIVGIEFMNLQSLKYFESYGNEKIKDVSIVKLKNLTSLAVYSQDSFIGTCLLELKNLTNFISGNNKNFDLHLFDKIKEPLETYKVYPSKNYEDKNAKKEKEKKKRMVIRNLSLAQYNPTDDFDDFDFEL